MKNQTIIKVLTGIFLIATSIFSGCGSLLNQERAKFRIESIPTRATVKTESGQRLGFTPLTIRLPRKTDADDYKVLIVESSNYRRAKLKIKPEFNKRSLFNFIFFPFSFGLPSYTTDNINRSLYRFAPGSFVVELKPTPKVSKSKSISKSKKSTETKVRKESVLKERQEKSIQELNAEEALEAERQKIKQEKAKIAAEKAELERLKLEAERIKLEEERRALEKQKEEMKQKLQEAEDKKKLEEQTFKKEQARLETKAEAEKEVLKGSEKDSQSTEERIPETAEEKEQRLLEKMKQKYQRQLKERQKKRQTRDPRIPAIEVNPLSDWESSPSYGALALSITNYHLLIEDLSHGGGESLEDIFIRLALSRQDRSFSSTLLAKTYPRFIKLAQQQQNVMTAPHGLALFRALKPVHLATLSTLDSEKMP